MSEKRSTIKAILGLILTLVILIGGMYGFNVQVDVQDEQETIVEETTEIVTTDAETEKVEDVEDVDISEPTKQEPISTTESTPVADEQPDVDNSEDVEVAEPSEDETTATEGEIENA